MDSDQEDKNNRAKTVGANVTWILRNQDPTLDRDHLCNREGIKQALGLTQKGGNGQVSRYLSGTNAELKPAQVETIITFLRLRDQIPDATAEWFSKKHLEFVEIMRVAGFGLWKVDAELGSWIRDLPPLGFSALVPEQRIIDLIDQSHYRGDFGEDVDPDEIVESARLKGRYGIVIDEVPARIVEAIRRKTACIVLLHRNLPNETFSNVSIDLNSNVYFAKQQKTGDTFVDGETAKETLLLADKKKGAIRPSFGFEIKGQVGRREIAVFIFGTGSDLPEKWPTEAQDGKITPADIRALSIPLAKAAGRGDAIYGRLRFDAVP